MCHRSRGLPRGAATTASEARRRAVGFLLAAREGDGWWRDFETLAGVSDAWVTAYVACALAESEDARARAAARAAFELLLRRCPGANGWGYNSGVGFDADSTSWVCRLALALGEWLRVSRAAASLGACQRENGGLATYQNATGVRRSMHLAESENFEGWCSAHTCVTAAAAYLPTPFQAGALKYLRRSQSSEGCWIPYWWVDVDYATALAVEALMTTDQGNDDAALMAATKWAETNRSVDSPFNAACRMSILRRTSSFAAAGLRARLEDQQSSDGSWPSSARMRIPPPSMLHPEYCRQWDPFGKGISSIVKDRRRIYTTATVLRALAGL